MISAIRSMISTGGITSEAAPSGYMPDGAYQSVQANDSYMPTHQFTFTMNLLSAGASNSADASRLKSKSPR